MKEILSVHRQKTLTFSVVQRVFQTDFGQNLQLPVSDEDCRPLPPSQTLPALNPVDKGI